MLFLVQCSSPEQQENSSFDNIPKKDSCCNKEKISIKTDSTKIALQSEITCPKCGYKRIEVLPTDVAYFHIPAKIAKWFYILKTEIVVCFVATVVINAHRNRLNNYLLSIVNIDKYYCWFL